MNGVVMQGVACVKLAGLCAHYVKLLEKLVLLPGHYWPRWKGMVIRNPRLLCHQVKLAEALSLVGRLQYGLK